MRSISTSFLLTTLSVAAALFSPSTALNIHCNDTSTNALAYPLSPATTQHDALPFSFFLLDNLWCNYKTQKTCDQWTEAEPAQLETWPFDPNFPYAIGNPVCDGASFWFNWGEGSPFRTSHLHVKLANGTLYECTWGDVLDDMYCDAEGIQT